MASYQQLQNDLANYLNRQDILTSGIIPGWVSMVELEINETLRSRFQVTYGTQPIDAAYITMPPGFAAMESIRDATSGEMLDLKDQWSGHWAYVYEETVPPYGSVPQTAPLTPCFAYRLLADCIEFLPHPNIPNPPDPTWQPQQVLMGWYQKAVPLVLPTDTNAILDNLYGVYLFGTCKYGAMWALDDQRAQQMDAAFQQAVTRANLWKQGSDYSGAPLRAEIAVRF